jgi:hypothetical protein|tara:strand:+ start:286 stop:477 length:192 start_codon:yes stop_codon:yes gene_type:complete
MNYYFNEETIEYFHNRSYLVEDPDMLYDEMWNFVNVDYEVGDNESVDDAVKALIEVVTSHRNM